MTAIEIWKMYGGFVEASPLGVRLLVDIHAMRGSNKPGKNVRFRYQVMLNDVDQSCPIQFRSLRTAQKWIRNQMSTIELEEVLRSGKAKRCGL